MNEQEIEKEIQEKKLTAPRIKPEDLEAVIKREYFFTACEGVQNSSVVPSHVPDEALELLTFCVLVLKNGFTVTGESACASPANFNAELGRKIARQHAKDKLWPLLGYNLKQSLFDVEEKHQRLNDYLSPIGDGPSGVIG
jgi:hypothetical protein